MGVVAATTVVLRGEPFTLADLAQMPDDGRRYELVDGTLLVTPAPSTAHQLALTRIWRALDDARPADLRVVVAPFDVVLADDTVLQPDVVVARRHDLTEADLRVAPVLVVEVLSPSTRRVDRTIKLDRYAAAGVAHVWLVDPLEPRLTVLELTSAGTLARVADLGAGDQFRMSTPFPLDLDLSALLEDR